ncbi:MAG: transcriptional regulator GcvA [Ectothiorhodospiraceae bacterium]|jgi:LysR family glycine cleavage system transcriptional activator
MRIKPLPPLNSLVAFEAAARNLSFTAAATELSVTQGAISRHVRQLEDYLGKSLFIRGNRTIQLSATGMEYYQTVRASLQDLSEATAHVLQWRGDRQVTVATTTAMASLWLLPRIPAFQRQHENVDIRILASDQAHDFRNSEFDVALLYGATPPADMHATPLFAEEVFPVCSPEYLKSSGAIEHPEELFGNTLLYLDDAQLDWWDWPEWFRQVGLQPVEPRHRININNYPMLVQAAINGQGIALAWRHLVDEYLERGALIRPVETVLKTSAHFYLLEPPNRVRLKPSVRQFRDWLLGVAIGSR